MRGANDDELADLIEFGRGVGAEVRFIEYMDVGGATEWSLDKVFTRAEMLDRLGKRYGAITPVAEISSAPAERFTLPDGTVFGIIASTTTPFCRTCDRSRLTADGLWYLCLYAQSGIDLRQMLRAGASASELAARISSHLAGAHRPRRRVARSHRAPRRVRRHRSAPPGPAPRNAHPRGIDLNLHARNCSAWIPLCSARLQAGTVNSSTCSPSGERYFSSFVTRRRRRSRSSGFMCTNSTPVPLGETLRTTAVD